MPLMQAKFNRAAFQFQNHMLYQKKALPPRYSCLCPGKAAASQISLLAVAFVSTQLRTIDKHRGKDQDDVNVSPVHYGKLFEQASCSSIPGCPGITLTATCIAFTLLCCYATSQADISARRHNTDQYLFDASRQYGWDVYLIFLG